MAKDANLGIWNETDIHSASAGDKNPLFVNFTQTPKSNINCEVDDVESGAPLPYDASWNFNLQQSSPALTGGVTDFARLFPQGLAFFGLKKVLFLDSSNDLNYYFAAPAPSNRFGAEL